MFVGTRVPEQCAVHFNSTSVSSLAYLSQSLRDVILTAVVCVVIFRADVGTDDVTMFCSTIERRVDLDPHAGVGAMKFEPLPLANDFVFRKNVQSGTYHCYKNRHI